MKTPFGSKKTNTDEKSAPSFEKKPRMKGYIPFDYKDPLSLYPFIDGGKIIPARITALSHSQQRKLCNAVRKARSLGLLPITSQAHDDFHRPEPISPKPFKI